MLLADLSAVLAACPPKTTQDGYRAAVIDENVAGKGSLSSRQRTFRYLREMYWLDVDQPAFRALRRLWARDTEGRPLIALLVAHANDPALAATTSGILSLTAGDQATSQTLADAVQREFPGSYSPSIRAKIGRNALSSWTQAGLLTRRGRGPAVRQPATPPRAVLRWLWSWVIRTACLVSACSTPPMPTSWIPPRQPCTTVPTRPPGRVGWSTGPGGWSPRSTCRRCWPQRDDPRLPVDQGASG